MYMFCYPPNIQLILCTLQFLLDFYFQMLTEMLCFCVSMNFSEFLCLETSWRTWSAVIHSISGRMSVPLLRHRGGRPGVFQGVCLSRKFSYGGVFQPEIVDEVVQIIRHPYFVWRWVERSFVVLTQGS